MDGITITNASNADVNAQSAVSLELTFIHEKNTSSVDATALSRGALVDYAKAYGLDIYVLDGEGRRTATIDDTKIIPAINEYLTTHVLNVVASHRGSVAESTERATVLSTLKAS